MSPSTPSTDTRPTRTPAKRVNLRQKALFTALRTTRTLPRIKQHSSVHLPVLTLSKIRSHMITRPKRTPILRRAKSTTAATPTAPADFHANQAELQRLRYTTCPIKIQRKLRQLYAGHYYVSLDVANALVGFFKDESGATYTNVGGSEYHDEYVDGYNMETEEPQTQDNRTEAQKDADFIDKSADDEYVMIWKEKKNKNPPNLDGHIDSDDLLQNDIESDGEEYKLPDSAEEDNESDDDDLEDDSETNQNDLDDEL